MIQSHLFQCYCCGTIFSQSKVAFWDGQQEMICPMPGCEATELDFEIMPDNEVWEMFQIIIADFTEDRRMNLRKLAEAAMGPYNPLSRHL